VGRGSPHVCIALNDWDSIAEQVFGGLSERDYSQQNRCLDKLASWELAETTV